MTATAEVTTRTFVPDWSYQDWYDYTTDGVPRSYRDLAGDPAERLKMHMRVKNLRDPFACQILRVVPAPRGFAVPANLVITQEDIDASCVFSVGPFEKRQQRDPSFSAKDGDQVRALYAGWCVGYQESDTKITTEAELLLEGAGYKFSAEIEESLERMDPKEFFMLNLELIPHAPICACPRCKKYGIHMVPTGRAGACGAPLYHAFAGLVCGCPARHAEARTAAETMAWSKEAASGQSAPGNTREEASESDSVSFPPARAAEPTAPVQSGSPERALAFSFDEEETVPVASEVAPEPTQAESTTPALAFGDDQPAPKKRGRPKKNTTAPATPDSSALVFSGQSEATTEKSGIAIDQAKIDILHAEWDALIAQPYQCYDRRLVDASLEGKDDNLAVQSAHVEYERRLSEIAAQLPPVSAEFAAYAAIRIKKAESETERVTREAAVMVERAKRKESTANALMHDRLMMWARAQPRDGKTVRLPGTTHKIVFRSCDAGFDIVDENAAVKAIVSDLGEAKALEAGLVRKSFSLLKANLVGAMCEKKTVVPEGSQVPVEVTTPRKPLPGAVFVPAGDRPTIFRK